MKTEVTFPEQPLETRRDVFVKGIVGALAIAGYGSRTGIVLASVPGVTAGETPGAEEGPFWVDGQVKRVDMRPDSVTGVYPAGLPLYIGLTVSQLSDTAPYTITPLVGAQVDMWNANAQGVYSDEASESTTGTDYMRGYQTTNSHGVVNILTNYSGWYSGRTPARPHPDSDLRLGWQHRLQLLHPALLRRHDHGAGVRLELGLHPHYAAGHL